MPDWDLVKNLTDISFGISIIIERILKWVVKAINRAIQMRKDDLAKIKAGSVVRNEPKIMWVKMVNRPVVVHRALAIRHKFNRALENSIADNRNHFIMDTI